MRYLFAFILFLILLPGFSQDYGLYDQYYDRPSRESYNKTFHYLNSMLKGDTAMSFKNAVFTVENTYLNGKLNYDTFNIEVEYYASIASEFASLSNLKYEGSDKENMQKLGSIFMMMTSTKRLFLDSTHYLIPSPLTYDFDDFWGDRD